MKQSLAGQFLTLPEKFLHKDENPPALWKEPSSPPSNCNVVKNNIIAAYLNGSLSFIYSQWVFDKRKLSLETLIQLTTQLIAKGIDTLLR